MEGRERGKEKGGGRAIMGRVREKERGRRKREKKEGKRREGGRAEDKLDKVRQSGRDRRWEVMSGSLEGVVLQRVIGQVLRERQHHSTVQPQAIQTSQA